VDFTLGCAGGAPLAFSTGLICLLSSFACFLHQAALPKNIACQPKTAIIHGFPGLCSGRGWNRFSRRSSGCPESPLGDAAQPFVAGHRQVETLDRYARQLLQQRGRAGLCEAAADARVGARWEPCPIRFRRVSMT